MEGRYVDFDMKNAHPEILCQLLKTNRPEEAILWANQDYYCRHRVRKLKDVMEFHGVDRSCAKQLFVSLINHGTYDGWKRNNQVLDTKTMPFVVSFNEEIKRATKVLMDANLELCDAIKTSNEKNSKNINNKGRIISKVALCQNTLEIWKEFYWKR